MDNRSLEHKVNLIARSTERLQKALLWRRDEYFWVFLRKEAWVHLKRAIELWWMAVRGKS